MEREAFNFFLMLFYVLTSNRLAIENPLEVDFRFSNAKADYAAAITINWEATCSSVEKHRAVLGSILPISAGSIRKGTNKLIFKNY